jgi:hypothetical protein
MSEKPDHTFWGFLKENDFIFASWGIIAGILLYLLDLYLNALEKQEEWKIFEIQGINFSNISVHSEIVGKNTAITKFFPICIGSLYFIFLILSLAIIYFSWVKAEGLDNYPDKKIYNRNVIIYGIFNALFMIFEGSLFLYVYYSFPRDISNIFLSIELTLLIFLVILLWSTKQIPPKNEATIYSNP